MTRKKLIKVGPENLPIKKISLHMRILQTQLGKKVESKLNWNLHNLFETLLSAASFWSLGALAAALRL